MKRAAVFLAASSLAVTACTPATQSYAPQRPAVAANGVTERFAMGEVGYQMRAIFPVRAMPTTGNIAYATSAQCDYSARFSANHYDEQHEASGRITLNQHNDAILTYVEIAGAESSSSIDRLGRVSEFNATMPGGGSVRSWNLQDDVAQLSASRRTVPLLHSLVLLPEYRDGPWFPRSSVASLRNAQGDMVGEYIYRGLMGTDLEIQRGAKIAAIDIVTSIDRSAYSGPQDAIVVGWMMIDLNTMLPKYYFLREGDGGFVSLTEPDCE